MLQKIRGNAQGFTLIELMIVIAIIGILAAIAIPNFIAYRNKSYCSTAEKDASSIAGGIADYFAIPGRTTLPTTASDVGLTIANPNTISGDPNTTITITVEDASGRCPDEYQDESDYWDSGTNIYTKYVR